MSIVTIIAGLQTQGKLVPYAPQRTTAPARRRLYLSADLFKALNNANNGVVMMVGRGEMEAQMTLWTAGERVYDNGKAKPGPGFLKRLKAPPPEIWEIRVTAPVSQARIFGRFAEPDTFIATDMWTRQALGKAKSPTWSKAMKQCETDWNKLFPGDPPFSGTKMSDYVTENCDDFTL